MIAKGQLGPIIEPMTSSGDPLMAWPSIIVFGIVVIIVVVVAAWWFE